MPLTEAKGGFNPATWILTEAAGGVFAGDAGKGASPKLSARIAAQRVAAVGVRASKSSIVQSDLPDLGRGIRSGEPGEPGRAPGPGSITALQNSWPGVVALPSDPKITLPGGQVLNDRIIDPLLEVLRRQAAEQDARNAAIRLPAPQATVGGVGREGEMAVVITNKSGGEPVADLGTSLVTLGSEYIRARYGGGQSRPALNTYPEYSSPGIDIGGYRISPDIPLVDIRRVGAGGRRRRRRRLLTPTDYQDLATLKTLTGNNAAFTAAVIKAVRR